MTHNPYNTRQTLKTPMGELNYWSLQELKRQGFGIEKLPFSIRILLENVLRNYDDFAITKENVDTILNWKPQPSDKDIPFKPARVLMQDFTGVAAVVDLASLRDEAARKGKDPNKINPLIPVDLVIDHSIQVDFFGTEYALQKNVNLEFERNGERYQFLKWAQETFNNFSVVPPGMGICHQVNLEYLAKVVISRDGNVFPDTLVGTDSHTPMVNGIGVVGWGVGGIEAEAALLGQPTYFIMPEVVGLKLVGNLPVGTTATDLVLNITASLRKHGVVGKFVEVFGPGLDSLSGTDRATISNMSPEFGCTITYFPVDNKTLEYLRKSNRSEDQVNLVESYAKANMLWRENEAAIQYSSVVELDLNTIEPTVAGPKRPQDKILLKELQSKFIDSLGTVFKRNYIPIDKRLTHKSQTEAGNIKTAIVEINHESYPIHDGSVVIAAITSCTNTSNPNVMIGAGLLARKALKKGLNIKPWVKTSLAPGSKVVTDYLTKSGLIHDLEALKFFNTGYGCSSCIGNSGPLPAPITKAVIDNELAVASVLSGNRNFEARVHPHVKMNFLMSPMLVVAFALVGRVDLDLTTEPLGFDPNMEPVYLKDIWPSNEEISEIMSKVLTSKDFENAYSTVFSGNDQWQGLKAPEGQLFKWDSKSTYIKEAPFFVNISSEPAELKEITGANVLLKLGDSITTDHISPAGSFNENTPAGRYLLARNVEKSQFNSYGSRRGNDEIMVRGTFANVRIKNQLIEKEGGYTKHIPSGEEMSVFDASEKYMASNVPLIVLAGKEYGSGSSRDWAAKGPNLLGIKAVIAESYERIHRSNLVGMGILPLQFIKGQNADSLGFSGAESFQILGIANDLKPSKTMKVQAKGSDGKVTEFEALCRLDSAIEVEYYRHGGILHYVLRQFLKS